MLLVVVSDPVGIRTRDPQLRRLLLYPAELPDLVGMRLSHERHFSASLWRPRFLLLTQTRKVWVILRPLVAKAFRLSQNNSLVPKHAKIPMQAGLLEPTKAIWAQRYCFFLTYASLEQKNYKSSSKSSCNLVLFIAPTVRLTNSPFLKKRIVGIFIIPY